MNVEIDGKKYAVTVVLTKSKTIRIRTPRADLIKITTPKKLTSDAVYDLLSRNKDKIKELIKQISSPLHQGEIIVLGKIYRDLNQDSANKLFDEAFLAIERIFASYRILFKKEKTALVFKKMHSRWGSCQVEKDRITLSSYVVHLPPSLINYIIVHEFAHFRCPNHSQTFYKIVAEYYPSYKSARRQLRGFLYVMK